MSPAHDIIAARYQALRRDFSRLAGVLTAARVVIENGDLDIGVDVLAMAEGFACDVLTAHDEQSGGNS